uniref:DUF5745 domain-containing protein n=1 Tax=Plectus sambesii TaxID=2011161 RepID=A0A914W7T3_9BILA
MASTSKQRVTDICRDINIVLRKYLPSLPAISSLSQLNARTLLRLFDVTCGPYLEERPLLPDVDRDPARLLQVLVDVIACDFLNVDLAPRITGQKLAANDEEAASSFLSILDKLSTCLREERSQQTTNDEPAAVATRSRLTPPLRRLGHRSVLYSPRTAFKRSSVRSTAIRQSVKDAVRRMLPDVKTAAAAGSSRLDIIKRTKEASRRRRELVELKQARNLLDNAKKSARHRAISDARRQDEFSRQLAAQRLQLEATKMMAAEKVRDAWAQSAVAAKTEFANRLKTETKVKNTTVLQRIAALENRQRLREHIIRDQYNVR